MKNKKRRVQKSKIHYTVRNYIQKFTQKNDQAATNFFKRVTKRDSDLNVRRQHTMKFRSSCHIKLRKRFINCFFIELNYNIKT